MNIYEKNFACYFQVQSECEWTLVCCCFSAKLQGLNVSKKDEQQSAYTLKVVEFYFYPIKRQKDKYGVRYAGQPV